MTTQRKSSPGSSGPVVAETDPSTTRPAAGGPRTSAGPVPGQEQDARIGMGRTGLRAVQDLVDQAEESVATLTHAAENAENGGLKLLLKAVATLRAFRVMELRRAAGMTVDPAHEETNWTRRRELADGMTDIQASMSVQREERQHVALYELGKSEAELLATYDAVLSRTGVDDSDTDNLVPPALAKVVEDQRAEMATLQHRLSHMDEKDAPLIVARVFDDCDAAQRAVSELHERGLARTQVDLLQIAAVPKRQADAVTAPANPRSTVVAGAVTGAVVGGVVGLAAALFVYFAPQLIGWLTVGPWVLFLGSLIPGALMGAVFGWIIGQNRMEDDRNVTEHQLREGECVVAAYPSQAQVSVAEDVLQIHHARSLGSDPG